ncbi:hypothetical protein [Martelella alba]|nr:hypothetical protein [Martelella alba]
MAYHKTARCITDNNQTVDDISAVATIGGNAGRTCLGNVPLN